MNKLLKFKSKKFKAGFTLIELMVIISIISVLSGAGVVATGHVRDNAKKAKVKQEVHSVESSLDVYEASEGGMPNPNPGERKLYCVGSENCALNGHAVSAYLNPETGALSGGSGLYFGDDLLSFDDGSGTTQGYMYMSCQNSTPTCDPADTAIIYANPSASYYSYLSDPSSIYPITQGSNNPPFDFLTFFGFDLEAYPTYTGNSGGESPNYNDSNQYSLCGPSLPVDTSEWLPRFSIPQGVGWCDSEVLYYVEAGPSLFVCYSNPPYTENGFWALGPCSNENPLWYFIE